MPGTFVQESGDILVFCPDGTSYDISRPYRTELVYISTSGYRTGLVIDGQVYSPISPNYYGATHSINIDGEIVVARVKVTVSTQDWLSLAATYSIGSCEADLLMLLKRQ